MAQKPLKSLPPARRPEPEVRELQEATPRPAIPNDTPGFRLPKWAVGGLVVVGLAVLVAVLAGSGVIEQIRERVASAGAGDQKGEKGEHGKKDEYPKLLLDARGRPVNPPTIVLDETQARALEINAKTVVPAVKAVEPRALPSMEGQLNYNIERLYSVRPRFSGEVQSFGQVLVKPLQKDGGGSPPDVSWKTRDIGVGDPVKGPHVVDGKEVPGTLLAVVWSRDLADKKAALIDALIDLRRDRQRLAKLEKGWREGVIPEATYYEAQRTVRKDINAVNGAERILRIWKLSDAEIQAIRIEAARIEETKRDPRKEQDWARVEVRAPHDGYIVEKNTNMGDWVDASGSQTAMFKVADLSELAVWIYAREEYRLTIQQLLFQGHDSGIRMDVRLLAEPDAAPLKGEILRIAPSVDPNLRTMLVIGRVDNPGNRLLVGQSVVATAYLKPGPNQVQIPTTALNEQDGQSLVFVQPDPGKLAFALRRVAVTHRFHDVVLVRSKLTPEDVELSRKDVRRGRRPIEPLRPGERVAARGVTMLTSELRDLTAEDKASAPNQ